MVPNKKAFEKIKRKILHLETARHDFGDENINTLIGTLEQYFSRRFNSLKFFLAVVLAFCILRVGADFQSSSLNTSRDHMKELPVDGTRLSGLDMMRNMHLSKNHHLDLVNNSVPTSLNTKFLKDFERSNPNSNGYILYTPSGGFNNQMTCLLTGMYMAKQTGRTLIVPPVGRHSLYYYGYLRLDLKSIAPITRAIDIEYISAATGVKMVIMNSTMAKFLEQAFELNWEAPVRHSKNLSVFILRRGGLTDGSFGFSRKILRSVTKNKSPYVLLLGRFFTRHFNEEILPFRLHLRYAKEHFELANLIISTALGNNFSSIHLRAGDKLSSRAKAEKKGGKFVEIADSIGIKPATRLYVATDCNSTDPLLEPLQEHFESMITFEDLFAYPQLASRISNMMQSYESRSFFVDMFGLVEQLVCVGSTHFLGSKHSTFSKSIYVMRKHLEFTWPDLHGAIEQEANLAPEDRTHCPRNMGLVHLKGSFVVDLDTCVPQLGESASVQTEPVGSSNLH